MRFVSVAAFILVFFAWLPAEALEVTYTGLIDCQGLRSGDCLEQRILPALGHGPALNLRASTETDTVHGHVSASLCAPPCVSTVTVTIYETDDLPSAARRSTVRRPVAIPNAAALQGQLRTLAPR